MNELTRMQYLDAMGIDMFVPTVRLPHAKASSQCPLPCVELLPAASNETSLDAIEPVDVDDHAVGVNGPVSVANVLADLRGECGEKERPEPALQPAPISTSHHTTSKESEGAALSISPSPSESIITPELVSAHFTLGMWRVEPHLQIIDSRLAGDALPTDVLLRNILKIHDLLPQPMPAQEILHWPLPGVALTDTSWGAAHDMVISFLEGRLSANPVSAFLVFGEDAFCALMGETANFTEALYQSVTVDSFATEVIVLPSLRSLLHNPLEKKRLWPVLQRLSHQIKHLSESQV